MTVSQLISKLEQVKDKNKDVMVYVSDLKDNIMTDDWCDTFGVYDVDLEDDFGVIVVEVSSQNEYFKSHKGEDNDNNR